jgi:hypothetical protein
MQTLDSHAHTHMHMRTHTHTHMHACVRACVHVCNVQMCEDLEDEEGLRHCHVALRSAVLLNDTALLEEMFSNA